MYFLVYLSLWSAGLPGLFAFPQILDPRNGIAARASGTMPSGSRDTGTATVSKGSCPGRNLTTRSTQDLSARADCHYETAGIGVELEAHVIRFKSPTLSSADRKDTVKLKGTQFTHRLGSDWKLTGDTFGDLRGELTAEYIMDGKSIKLNTGKAKENAIEVAEDIVY